MRFFFEPLNKTHDRKHFDCGAKELNTFLQEQAAQRQKKYNAVTHVAVNLDTENIPKIIYGYYTLSNYSLERERLPHVDAKKTAPKEKVPALKLGRIARNKLFTKPGFGEVILMDVFKKAIEDDRKHMFIAMQTVKEIFDSKDLPRNLA